MPLKLTVMLKATLSKGLCPDLLGCSCVIKGPSCRLLQRRMRDVNRFLEPSAGRARAQPRMAQGAPVGSARITGVFASR